jgi:tRNA (cmo5U34)-methyltransferase
MDAGDKIKTKLGAFSFGGSTPKNFDKHVTKSVPLYDMGQNMICKLSSFFLNNESMVYDLGCSTGTLIKKLIEYNKGIKFKAQGFDIQKNMIKEAKKKNRKKNNLSFKCEDLSKVKLKKSDFIVSYYTIQFIKPKHRQLIFNKIYKSLNWGGAFVLFEKVRGPDARFQDLMTQIYSEYKKDIGYNETHIYNKSLSLRGVLEPYTTKANIDFLKRAGFTDITSVMKFSCFEGFLAIK